MMIERSIAILDDAGILDFRARGRFLTHAAIEVNRDYRPAPVSLQERFRNIEKSIDKGRAIGIDLSVRVSRRPAPARMVGRLCAGRRHDEDPESKKGV
jgi:hypothetical protein